jgi:hypothetical protein
VKTNGTNEGIRYKITWRSSLFLIGSLEELLISIDVLAPRVTEKCRNVYAALEYILHVTEI